MPTRCQRRWIVLTASETRPAQQPDAKEGDMVEVARVPFRTLHGGKDPPGSSTPNVGRGPRTNAGPAQAARLAALASLVRSGQYRVPGTTEDGSPLRAYRQVSAAV